MLDNIEPIWDWSKPIIIEIYKQDITFTIIKEKGWCPCQNILFFLKQTTEAENLLICLRLKDYKNPETFNQKLKEKCTLKTGKNVEVTYFRSGNKSGFPHMKCSVESSICGEVYAVITDSLGNDKGKCQFLHTFLWHKRQNVRT